MTTEETIKVVGGIRFSTLPPSEIRRYAVAEITAPETYDEDGMPVQGGLMDNRLGVLEPGQKCGTCGNAAGRCPGHFGYIELAEAVLHIAFVDEIHRLLMATCRACGRLKLPEDDLAKYRERLEKKDPTAVAVDDTVSREIILKAKKTKACPHCGKPQYEIEFTKPTVFHEITEGGGATRLLPVAIRERLERVRNDDLRLLGYDPNTARPEWFVLQVLPVPPVAVRPSITLESGIRSEDDLTHKVVDILRVNQRVRESKESGTPPLIVQDLVDLLQYHVTTFFDNEVSGIPQAHHRSGRALKTLSQRLKGKEGRFRGSLSGKRVDFSSRTVISPDPCLDVSEVGVPLDVARKLTIPEKISPWNINFLKQLVVNGPTQHPGANYVIRPDGVRIRLDYVSDRTALSESLAPGYVVERHIADGDIVIFNRQPSLHRMSIMAHHVRVLPYRTFRLHPAVCPPYNADFDGDEMNLHVPQSEEARSEAIQLMRVQDQLLSPRYGGPIIGGIRDFLTAAYLISHESTLLTPQEFCSLAVSGGYVGPLPAPAKDGPSPMYTGKQLFSLFLPRDFNYVMTSRWVKSTRSGEKRDVVIKNGELANGLIDRAAIGAEEPDSVLHRIAKDYGTEQARGFLTSILSVLKDYLTMRGFTLGLDDFYLTNEAKASVSKSIDESYSKVRDLIQQYKNKKLTLVRGLSAEETLEFYIVNELAKARDRAGKIADQAFSEENASVIMAKTGARGSALNMGQMSAALGQQSVRGRRIEKGYQGRAMTHFPSGETSPDARGFIRACYRDGLAPTEFFFHAMGGREGLVDTAVRTQQSGYMQRRLVNALEHLKVEYDLTVRDPEGRIIQFIYGEDGVDPSKSDHGKSVNVERLVETEMMQEDKGKKVSPTALNKILKEYEADLNLKLIESLKEALVDVPQTTAERVCKKTVELLRKATVEPGEASGIVAAQSIGEPGTQMTLRTFHFAGVKERDVTLGLPRLIELVDARKLAATPVMEVYMDKENRASNEGALHVARSILFTKVGAVVEKTEVDVSGDVTLVLSPSRLQERDCTVEMVGEVVESGKRKVEVDEAKKAIRVRVEGADLPMLFTLRNKLLNVKVKGIPGIDRVTVSKEEDEWVIHTKGSNLAKVLKISGVDLSRTTTNNVYEVYQTLGIEAARAAIVKEIMGTLEEQGLEVDIRHIYLVADLMTSRGILQQIGRHGIAGKKTSVLARAAFEITVPTLAEAAVKGEKEELRGVTENVIVGMAIPVGTGMVQVYMKGHVPE
ncbi:MAG: DNA-directed RNA polymerase subunit A' [Thaumarchaeota archaeon]|nr:DNA-directed RNA polymerase subunit A' [Nitrososphaerota archaeon]